MRLVLVLVDIIGALLIFAACGQTTLALVLTVALFVVTEMVAFGMTAR